MGACEGLLGRTCVSLLRTHAANQIQGNEDPLFRYSFPTNQTSKVNNFPALRYFRTKLSNEACPSLSPQPVSVNIGSLFFARSFITLLHETWQRKLLSLRETRLWPLLQRYLDEFSRVLPSFTRPLILLTFWKTICLLLENLPV